MRLIQGTTEFELQKESAVAIGKFDGVHRVETYIYQFNEELYGHEITVALLYYRRPEMKFQNIEELKHQMQKDREAGAEYFNL